MRLHGRLHSYDATDGKLQRTRTFARRLSLRRRRRDLPLRLLARLGRRRGRRPRGATPSRQSQRRARVPRSIVERRDVATPPPAGLASAAAAPRRWPTTPRRDGRLGNERRNSSWASLCALAMASADALRVGDARAYYCRRRRSRRGARGSFAANASRARRHLSRRRRPARDALAYRTAAKARRARRRRRRPPKAERAALRLERGVRAGGGESVARAP